MTIRENKQLKIRQAGELKAPSGNTDRHIDSDNVNDMIDTHIDSHI